MKTREILDHYGNGGFISPEDLNKLRDTTARFNAAQSGNPGISFENAVRAVRGTWEMYQGLREKYGIEPDDAVEFSLFDGAILDSESAEEQ